MPAQSNWKRHLRQICMEYHWTDRLDRARGLLQQSNKLAGRGEELPAAAMLHKALHITAGLRSDIEELGEHGLAAKMEAQDRGLRKQLERLDPKASGRYDVPVTRLPPLGRDEDWKKKLDDLCLKQGWSERLTTARKLLQSSSKKSDEGVKSVAAAELREALTLTARLRSDVAGLGETRLAIQMEAQDNILRNRLGKLDQAVTEVSRDDGVAAAEAETEAESEPSTESDNWKDNLRHLCLVHGWSDRLDRARSLLKESVEKRRDGLPDEAASWLEEGLLILRALRADVLALGEVTLALRMQNQNEMLEERLGTLRSGKTAVREAGERPGLDLEWKDDLEDLCAKHGWTSRLEKIRALLKESSFETKGGDQARAAALLRNGLELTEDLRGDVLRVGEEEVARSMEMQNQMLRTQLDLLQTHTETPTLEMDQADEFLANLPTDPTDFTDLGEYTDIGGSDDFGEECPTCGRLTESDWTACPYCRTALLDLDTCPQCSRKLEEEWVVCPFCRTDLVPS